MRAPCYRYTRIRKARSKEFLAGNNSAIRRKCVVKLKRFVQQFTCSCSRERPLASRNITVGACSRVLHVR